MLTGAGIDELWSVVREHRDTLESAGVLRERRNAQAERWMWSLVEERLFGSFRAHPEVRALLDDTVAAVKDGSLPPGAAAERLLSAYRS